MDDLTETLLKHRDRLNEIVSVLGRYGLAAWASREGTIPGVRAAKHVADAELENLSPGQRLRGALTELGATGVKFGQMLSLRPDLVGPDVARELEGLQASVPADPADVVRPLVEHELGHPIAELFATFDGDAMGSGSIAQVHRATLDDGTTVAVKVLHAGVDRKVLADLDLLQALARFIEPRDPELARYRPTVLVDEFQKMMHASINLSQELANLQRFSANFADEPDVVIPTPFPERSSTRVVTMQLIEGRPFDRENIEAAGWDVDQLVDRAANIYLEMIFRDGVYHADPHPGNFLLLDEHRLGILDFGDVGYLSGPRKAQLEELVIAIGTRDVDHLTDVVVQMTSPPESVDVLQLRGDIDVWLNTYFMAGVAHLDMPAIVDSGMALMQTHGLVLPADLALLFRVMLRLQGLGRSVGTDVRVTELLDPYLGRILADRFNPKRIAAHAVRTARSWEHLIDSLPDEVLATLERVRTGELGVDFRVRDVDQGIDRLVDGLLAAASILGAAQLISRKAPPTIGGVSLPGLVSVGIGAVTWQRLAMKRPTHETLLQRAREVSEVARR
jgi:ubiquinone biosynthesis protein